MRVLISTDLEGISGVCVWEQTREMTSAMYQEARRLLMGDIAAAMDGCLEGGADEVVVSDGHGGGFNIVPELMHPQARYLTGRSRPPLSQRADIHQGFDAAILLGFHAMAGTPDGMLRHSQSSRRGDCYWYNDRPCGEIAQESLFFGHFGIPVVMVTGDRAATREAHDLLGPEIVTVAVKEGFTAEYGLLLSPAEAHRQIREGARDAMGRAASLTPFEMELPIRGRLRFPDKSAADGFRPVRAQRVDDYTYEATFESALYVFEF